MSLLLRWSVPNNGSTVQTVCPLWFKGRDEREDLFRPSTPFKSDSSPGSDVLDSTGSGPESTTSKDRHGFSSLFFHNRNPPTPSDTQSRLQIYCENSRRSLEFTPKKSTRLLPRFITLTRVTVLSLVGINHDRDGTGAL